MSNKPPISGLLNINKPAGLTSHDVVQQVRKISGERKVGHTGTLDPLATGVLLVCVGQATRLIEYIMATRKQYRATIHFGRTTDTHDAEGEITSEQDISGLREAQLWAALPQFCGEIMQVPPIYSALKQNGKPLYKLARAGETVTVKPRPVTIDTMQWLAWEPPHLTVKITCSPGTYIRALARDLGQAMGVGAYLADLTRTANGPWHVEQAVPLAQLTQAAEWTQYLHPLDEAVPHLPAYTLTTAEMEHVQHGRAIPLNSEMPNSSLLRAYTPDDQFLAIMIPVDDAQSTMWRPKKLFHL